MISEVVAVLLGNEEKKNTGRGKSVQHAQVCSSSALLFVDACRAQWPASKDIEMVKDRERVASES
jgi:hypothetical protein